MYLCGRLLLLSQLLCSLAAPVPHPELDTQVHNSESSQLVPENPVQFLARSSHIDISESSENLPISALPLEETTDDIAQPDEGPKLTARNLFDKVIEVLKALNYDLSSIALRESVADVNKPGNIHARDTFEEILNVIAELLASIIPPNLRDRDTSTSPVTNTNDAANIHARNTVDSIPDPVAELLKIYLNMVDEDAITTVRDSLAIPVLPGQDDSESETKARRNMEIGTRDLLDELSKISGGQPLSAPPWISPLITLIEARNTDNTKSFGNTN